MLYIGRSSLNMYDINLSENKFVQGFCLLLFYLPTPNNKDGWFLSRCKMGGLWIVGERVDVKGYPLHWITSK